MRRWPPKHHPPVHRIDGWNARLKLGGKRIEEGWQVNLKAWPSRVILEG